MNYLLDTNAVSETIKPKPNKNVEKFFREIPAASLYISVLSFGELRKGIESLDVASKKRQRLTAWLEQDLANFYADRLININQAVADKWGYILGTKKNKIPAIDSLIAATAITYNLKLVTRNLVDFKNLPVEIFNPWDN